MPGFTSRLNLYKPGGGSSGTIPDEVVDVDRINDNSDLIDAAVGAPNYTSGTRPPAPFPGQIIYETDTDLVKQWSGSAWLSIGGLDVAEQARAMYNGLALGTQDLDTLLKSGSYRQTTGADATVARHYPFEGARGVLTVEAGVDSYRQTLHYWLNNPNTAIYERTKLSTNAWSPWRCVYPAGVLLPPAGVVGATVTGGKGLISFNNVAEVVIGGVFDASFEHYEILFDVTTLSASGINAQLTQAGTPAATAIYDNQRTTSLGTTVSTVQTIDVTEIQFSPVAQVAAHVGRMMLTRPGVADTTRYQYAGNVMPTTPSAAHGNVFTTGQHVASTAYDGIRIYAATGNITGRITVRGIA